MFLVYSVNLTEVVVESLELGENSKCAPPRLLNVLIHTELEYYSSLLLL